MDGKSKGSKEILAMLFMKSGDNTLEAGGGCKNKKYKGAQFDDFFENWFH